MGIVVLTDKNNLLLPLKALAALEKRSPYAAVQLPLTSEGRPQFYCSSANGFVQTKDYVPGPATYVSLSHLIDCLRNLPEDAVELGVDANGILRIYGTSSDIFESESHVLTVAEAQAGLKRLDTGERRIILDPKMFSGIDVRPFKCLTPPVIANGRLMLSTLKGATILWNGPEAMQQVPELYPHESFLKAVSGAVPVEELSITENGYWGAVVGDIMTYVKGHFIGRQIFTNYSIAGKELARLPANRLLEGLGAAIGLLNPTETVDIDPRLGVLARGKFGDNRNSLGETGSWPKFTVLAKTADVIYDALKQTPEDEAILMSVPGTTGATLRLKRGPFEVNFRQH